MSFWKDVTGGVIVGTLDALGFGSDGGGETPTPTSPTWVDTGGTAADPEEMMTAEEIAELARQIEEQSFQHYIWDVVPTSFAQGATYAESFSDMLSDRHYAELESILPTWREDVLGPQLRALEAVEGVAAPLARGELPDDVVDQVLLQSAERYSRAGVYGPASETFTLKDLGMTTLDAQLMGAQLYTEGVSPLAGRLGTSAMSFMPPYVDPAAFSLQILSGATGTMIPPGSTMQTGAQLATAQAEMAWDQHLSQMEFAMEEYAIDMGLRAEQITADAMRDAAQMEMIGELIGAAGSAAGLGG